MSNHELDYRFAWRTDCLHLRSGDTRPRIFEWIQKVQRIPQGKDKRWRDMCELVQAVDADKQFSGTRELYEAEFWWLCRGLSMSPQSVEKRLDRLLSQFGLIRGPLILVADSRNPFSNQVTPRDIFDRCLRLSLRRVNRISGLALVWLVYLLTEPAHNRLVRELVEALADQMFDRFFADYGGKYHLDFYADAIGTLQATRLDLSGQNGIGYGFFETSGVWPIIPSDMVGRITERLLFPEIC